jgi:hypothetical protein
MGRGVTCGVDPCPDERTAVMAKERKERVMTEQETQAKSERPRIVAQPAKQQLRPTEQQKQQMDALFAWEKQSKKIHWIVGQPTPCSI